MLFLSGLILALQPKDYKRKRLPTRLCVANTHLLFNMKRGDVKLAQLAYLFAHLHKLAQKPSEYHFVLNLVQRALCYCLWWVGGGGRGMGGEHDIQLVNWLLEQDNSGNEIRWLCGLLLVVVVAVICCK